jgi:DNA-binding NtrC family response regulator
MKNKPGTKNKPTLINVLSVSPIEDDHTFLEDTLGNQAALDTDARQESIWLLHRSANLRSAHALLRENRIAVVLCERDVPGTWRELLKEINILQNPPSLIVTSRLADNHLWAEALNLGAYDVLAKPFDTNEVVRSLRSAWLHWAGGERGELSRPEKPVPGK